MDYQFEIPRSRGLQASNVESVQPEVVIKDLFAHLLFARVALTDGQTCEFETSFDSANQKLNLNVSSDVLDIIENITKNDSFNRFITWLLADVTINTRDIIITVNSSSTLNNQQSFVEQTTDGITTSLWAEAVSGDKTSIRNRGGGAANIISGNGNNIEGSETFSLANGESVTLVYNGTEWIVF